MAIAQGIPVESIGAIEEYAATSAPNNLSQKVTNPNDKLIQWRFMIYPISLTVRLIFDKLFC